MADAEIPKPDVDSTVGTSPLPPKKGLAKDVGSFFKGLSGSIEDANNAVKGLEPTRRRTVGDMVDLLRHRKAGPPYKHCDDYAWAKNVINWSNIDLVVLIVFTCIIWFGVYKVNNRPLYNVVAKEALDTRMREYRSMPFLDQDTLIVWLVTTLQLIGQSSPYGKPFLPGVVNQVSPTIYKNTVTSYSKNVREFVETSTIYNTVITKVVKLYVNEEDKRVTVYLQGFITRMVTNPKTIDGRTMSDKIVVPYRAKAIVSQTVASKLNPTGFFLEELEEKFGDDGIKWFAELGLAGSKSPVVAVPKDPNAPPVKSQPLK